MLSRRGARPLRRIHKLFTCGRERPHAARQLLQSKRSTSTPRMIARTPFTAPLVAHGLSFSVPLPFGRNPVRVAVSLAGYGQSRLHGPGAWPRILRSSASASPAAIACERGLHPNPINSDISCRQLVTMQPWKTLHRQALDGCPLTNSPSNPHVIAWAALKGRFPRSPAKRSAIVCTRDAFHYRIAPGGAGLSSTSCPQPVDY
jgi:hypothetical protein